MGETDPCSYGIYSGMVCLVCLLYMPIFDVHVHCLPHRVHPCLAVLAQGKNPSQTLSALAIRTMGSHLHGVLAAILATAFGAVNLMISKMMPSCN